MSDGLVRINDPQDSLVSLQSSITSLSEPLANYLTDLGLPIDNILQPIEERKKSLIH